MLSYIFFSAFVFGNVAFFERKKGARRESLIGTECENEIKWNRDKVKRNGNAATFQHRTIKQHEKPKEEQ